MTFTCARWCTSAWKIARTIRPPSSCGSRPSLAIPSSHPPMRPWGANTGRRLLLSTQRENSGRRKHQLASVYNHIGLLDKASGEAQKAVALDPRNTGARFRVGINLLYQGKYEESLAGLAKLACQTRS